MPDLEGKIGYRFRDPAILEQALSHASLHAEGESGRSYQRLEFLGDSVLNLCVAQAVFDLLPEAGEGALTRARAAAINNRTLVTVGERIGLRDALLTDPSLRGPGGGVTRKMVADAMEALVGAIFLDGGFDEAAAFVRRHLGEAVAGDAIASGGDAKSRLQEWCQANGHPLPTYRLLDASGPPHSRTFHVDADAGDGLTGSGSGRTKKEAEMEAAAAVLARIERGAV